MPNESAGRGRTVLERIQEVVIADRLGAGDRLPTEHELSARLGVSRNAVREALRALEALGILEIRHGHGIYLREPTLTGLAGILAFYSRLFQRDGLASLQAMAEAREALETTLVVKVMPLLTDDDLDELSETVSEMERAVADGRDGRHIDRRFHDVLYRRLDNWIVTYLIDAFWEAFFDAETSRPHRATPVTVAQHHDIVKALRRRDADQVVKAMRRHFDNSLRRSTTRRRG